MLYKINLFYIIIIHLIYFSSAQSGRAIKLVVFNKKFLKFFAKLPRPKYIPCVDNTLLSFATYFLLFTGPGGEKKCIICNGISLLRCF